MKRFLLILLTLFICAGMFGCGLPATDPAGENASGTLDGPPATDPPALPVSVIADGTTEYLIIRPMTPSDAIKSAAADLRNRLNDATGANVKIKDDWYKQGDTLPEQAREIVVGNCDRPAVGRIASELREFDFAIVYDNERIYIIGGGDEATLRAIDYFIDTYLDVPAKSVTVKTGLNHIDRYEYPLGKISVGGVDVTEYRIVIPSNTAEAGYFYTNAAAMNLADYILFNSGFALDIVEDSLPAAEYEILLGKTNRPESVAAGAVPLAPDQFVLAATGSKIVMTGDSYMIGGAVSEFINNYAAPKGKNVDFDITTLPATYSAKTFSFKSARNAILLIGDGMGHNHVEATLAAGLSEFVAKQLPNIGTAVTYCYAANGSQRITDSAAAATSLGSGIKTTYHFLGVNRSGIAVQNVRELAASKGARTAVLTTDVITGATPGGFLVHAGDRGMTAEIQKQIDNLLKNKEIDFAVGGIGDGLVREAARQLWSISADGSLFFQMIEAAQIDKKSHSNDLSNVIYTTKRYNDVIAYCVQFALCHPDTALIVTADHETGGITFNESTQKYIFTSKDHTNADIPIYAIGGGTEYFKDKRVDNTDIAKFIAKIYGDNNFGR